MATCLRSREQFVEVTTYGGSVASRHQGLSCAGTPAMWSLFRALGSRSCGRMAPFLRGCIQYDHPLTSMSPNAPMTDDRLSNDSRVSTPLSSGSYWQSLASIPRMRPWELCIPADVLPLSPRTSLWSFTCSSRR